MQVHGLAIKIDINQVKLNIRFPGQLSFQLKNPHLYQDIQQMFPLVNGECKVAQTVSIQVEGLYNPTTQTYNEVIVDLIISINTTNGKIVAGIVNFNAIQNIAAHFPLKRCSDKAASLQMSVSFAKIKKLKDVEVSPIEEKNTQRIQSSPVSNHSSPMISHRISNVVKGVDQISKERGNSNSSEKLRQLMASSRVKASGVGVTQRLKQMEETNIRKLKIINKQKEETQAQLEETKQRYRLTERRQRELQNTIKELKQANEKKRIKINDLQFKLGDYQKIAVQNQKRIRQLHQQLKQSRQNSEQFISKTALLQKRLQTREQTTIQRQKRLIDKIALIEAQQIKTSHEYNDLLQQMQNQEKNSQQILKNKQKSFLQQKHKLKQQLDSLQKNYKALIQQNSDYLNKNVTITQLQKALQTKVIELQNELEKNRNLVATLTIEIERDNRNRQQLEIELSTLKQVQNEKGNLKKKLAAQYQQNQKTKDKLDKLTLQHQELKDNHSQQNSLLEQLRKEKKNFIIKQTQLQKLNLSLEKESSRITAENNALSSKNSYLTERSNDLKTKLEQQQRQFSQKQSNYLSKINSILQSKQYAISDLEDLKWSLQKQRENLLQAQRKLKQKNQKILEQQELILNLKKEIDQNKIKFGELQFNFTALQQQTAKFKQKSQEFVGVNKDYEHREFLLQKKIAQIEQENYINLNKLRKTNIDQLSTIQLQQSNIQKLNNQLESKIAANDSLQATYSQLLESYSELERNFKLQTMSLDEIDRLNVINEEKLAEFKKTNQELKSQLQEITKSNEHKLQEYEEKLENLSKRYQQTEKQAKLNKNDVQTYKKAVQQLFIIISSEESEKSQDIVAVPDSQLSKIQIEALLNRNKYISQLKQRNAELQVEIAYLQKESLSKAKTVDEKTIQLQNIIRQYNSRIIKIEDKFQQQRRDWLQKVERLASELTAVKLDKQKLQNKVLSLSQLYEQQKINKNQAQNLLESARETIRKLQASLLQIKSREINKKNQDENAFYNLKVSLNSQIQLYKEKVHILLKEKQSIQKSCLQKDKSIQALKAKISQTQIQKQKLQISISKLESQNGTLNSLKTQMQQTIHQKSVKIAFSSQAIQKLNLQIKDLKEIDSQISTKLNNAHIQISELSVKKEKLQNKLQENEKAHRIMNEEQKTKIGILQDLIVIQTKKSNKLHEQLSKISNQLQIKAFEAKQIQMKLESTQNLLKQVRKDNEEKRALLSTQDQAIQSLKRTIYGVQKEKSEHSVQKDVILQEFLKQKAKNEALQKQIKHAKQEKDSLQNKIRAKQLNYLQLDKQRSNLANINAQLKQMLNESKKEIQKANSKQSQIKSRLLTIQEQLKEKEEYYLQNKNKNWDQNQREITQLKDKLRKIQQKLKEAEKIWQLEREQLKASIQTSYTDRDQLQIMIEQRDQLIEKQEAQIIDGQRRIISLNNELRTCLEAWEKEKAAAIPSRKQAIKIEEDLGRFQNYANDLQKKTKQILSTSGVRAKDDLMATTTQSLIELQQVNHRAKSRAIIQVSQDKKVEIVKDYDKMKEIIEKILKIQKGSEK